MNKFFTLLALVALFLSTSASAEPLTFAEIKSACEERYTAPQSRAGCITALRLSQAEARDEEIVTRLAEGEERDGELLDAIREIATAVERLESAQVTQTAPVQAPVAQQNITSTQTGGVAFQVVPEVAMVSIHNFGSIDPDVMRLTNLGQNNSRARCGGGGATMVMFTNHGVPIDAIYVPNASAPSGFRQVYYDGNGDGQPDGGTVYALDLSSQDDVYVSWGQSEDIKVVYLRQSGQVAVHGLPLQTMYRPSRTSDSPANGVVACDMDSLDPKSGHRTKPVYSMSQAWR